jgi:hypothetical protein
MFWWFEKNGAYARCEVLQLPSGRYELRLVDADGSERVEHFDRAAELAERQSALEEDLRQAGWSGPHGWVL